MADALGRLPAPPLRFELEAGEVLLEVFFTAADLVVFRLDDSGLRVSVSVGARPRCDELIDEIAVCAPIGEVAKLVRERCRGRADRVSLVAHWTRDPDLWDDVIRDLSVD